MDLHECDLLANMEAFNQTQGNANSIGQSPVVRFIDKILSDAIEGGASDIHFEPYENQYRIRYRIDGMLITAAQPTPKLANVITARLKIMSNLDISERRVPQDGRFTLKLSTADTTTLKEHDQFTNTSLNSTPSTTAINVHAQNTIRNKNRTINFRINSCPTLHGEKIVLRILESNTELLQIDALGMTTSQQALFLKKLQQSQGMILVTGPTGSGKTSTLYSGINRLNSIEKNIFTVEDPVEIQLGGINQLPINLKTGLSFAVALRAFLRQDPDIIMVGEIRDLETAEIAVKASQTGHLVLSTLHTNSAAETLVRLVNMGIPSYNIASSISLIIAQRLLRRLCDHCKNTIELPQSTLVEAGFSELELEGLILYGPGDGSCQQCTKGYQGRLAIFEVMSISDTMARLIMQSANALLLAEQARKENILSLYQSGLEKVRAGLTSLMELHRIM